MADSNEEVLGEKVVDHVTEHCQGCGSPVKMDVLLQKKRSQSMPGGIDLVMRCGKGHVVQVKDKAEKLETLRRLAKVDDDASLYDSIDVDEDGALVFRQVGDFTKGEVKSRRLPIALLGLVALALAAVFAALLFSQYNTPPDGGLPATSSTAPPVTGTLEDKSKQFYFGLKFINMTPVETEVFVNNASLGWTTNYTLYKRVSELKPGWGYFKGRYGGKDFKLPFQVELDDFNKYGGILTNARGDRLWEYYSQTRDEYAAAITLDGFFRKMSSAMTVYCPRGDVSCEVAAVYENVTSSYSHYPDLRGGGHIQPANKTVVVEGGEYGDLNALILTLLANLNVKTYVMSTKERTYGLACGINREALKNITASGLRRAQDLRPRTDTIVLDGATYQTLSAGESVSDDDTLNVNLTVVSSQPVSVFVLSDSDGLKALLAAAKGEEQAKCSFSDNAKIAGSCTIPGSGIIAIRNDGPVRAKISYILSVHRVYFQTGQGDLKISSYDIGDLQCAPFDASFGASGYVGMEYPTNDTRVATDLSTGEQYRITG